ncbi:MAG: xylulokinase [Chloroflexi bacterium]|nr:xylulokinase [Chloroflexota bacterium]
MSYFLGIDSSTTATKALLMREDGEVVAVASSEYTYETPHPLWSEQHPDLWWDATAESIHAALAKAGVDGADVRGVGLTGQMHGLVLLDKDGEVLRPAILWNDQRTGAECDEIRGAVGKKRLVQITGNDALTGFTSPKVLWVKNNEPEIFARVAQILLPKDYVRYKLTGEYAMDKAGGAGTAMFDIRQRNWSSEVVKAMGVDPAWLPQTFEGTAVTGAITRAAAAATGLKVGTPVMGGGGDQAAGAVGTGAVVEGVVSLSLGTSGVVFAAADQPIVEEDGRLHAFCHAVPDKWHLMGVMLSAAGSLRWYRDTIAPGVSFDNLVNPAQDIPVGSNGLIYLPYLTGERTPYPDPLARGSLVGLTVRHTQAHMTRAVLEGVSFGLRDSFELMKRAGLGDVTQVRISGGGTKSLLWQQILADVLDTELVTVNTTEGAAYGAAVLAAVGAGSYNSVETACTQIIKTVDNTQPSGLASAYHDYYEVYQALYPSLKSHFAKLSRLDAA